MESVWSFLRRFPAVEAAYEAQRQADKREAAQTQEDGVQEARAYVPFTTKYFTKYPCLRCGKEISNAGWATFQHAQMHERRDRMKKKIEGEAAH